METKIYYLKMQYEDFKAIAENSNKALLMDGDEELYSQHAGYTEDEIFVPLIIIDKTKK